MKKYNKRLFRSKENKVFGGVMGGLGEYFDIDPVLFRVFYIFLTIFTGFFPGLIAYTFMVFVIPKRSEILKEDNIEVK